MTVLTDRCLRAHQFLAHHEHISERTSDKESIGILGHATLAHLGESEDAFDNPEGMFPLGAQR